VAATVLVVAVGGGLAVGATAEGKATKTISVKDDFFSPKSGTAKKGSTLSFQWAGKDPHHVVVSGKAHGSSPTQSSGTLNVKLKKKGTVKFHCTIHANMKGSITVN
jgi:plastocyanin